MFVRVVPMMPAAAVGLFVVIDDGNDFAVAVAVDRRRFWNRRIPCPPPPVLELEAASASAVAVAIAVAVAAVIVLLMLNP